MLCPLKVMNHNQHYNCECGKENCAWYNKNKEECCIKTVSESIEDVAEGQRIIFVKEY